MNDVEEKIITWRKTDNIINSKELLIINNNLSILQKKYTQKEKEYVNKYLNISKNFLKEENIYNIIIKFNFNDQLILAEIFHLMDIANENENGKENFENKANKSVFIPYKTKFGIMKSIYSLKKENKEKKYILCKEKKVYSYDIINNGINCKNNLNVVDENKESSYIKRFSDFNKIIEDYKSKKYKNDKFKKKNYNKNNINYKNNNYYYNSTYKYHNSKKYKNENNDNNEQLQDLKNNKNKFIKENIINFEYNNKRVKIEKTATYEKLCISEKIQIFFKPNNQKEYNRNTNIITIHDDKKNIRENVKEIKILNDKKPKTEIFFLNKKNNEENEKYTNINIKNNVNNSHINYNSKLNLNNNYIPCNYTQIYNNNYNNTFFNNMPYNNIYKNINNNINLNNKIFNSYNNISLNQRIGIPIYFPINNNNIYPSYYHSNNTFMNKNTINNNNIMNIPRMISMYYQGFNSINNIKLNSFYNCNKYYNYKNISNQINPMMYCLLMKNMGIKFIPNQMLN